MDIRAMQNYLTVTRAGNISAAAEALHLSQPALSRQMKELEEELGVILFERGKRKITLTEEGMVLRRRAEEMVRLLHLTEEEIRQVKHKITGDIHIGAGESHSFHVLSRTAGILHRSYPDIRLHITSGDTFDLMEQLDSGLLDFALLFSDFDGSQYHALPLPEEDQFGVLMRKDSPLAAKETISLADLQGLPLILSRLRTDDELIFHSIEASRLNVVATYNLFFNASLLVEDGVGYALVLDRLVNTTGDSPLCFRPLAPAVKIRGNLIWKKHQIFSPAVQLFIETLREQLANVGSGERV